MNPIELIWNYLKDYIRKEAKPKTKEELEDAIDYYWHNILTVATCNNVISRLAKVLPAIVQNNGGHSGMWNQKGALKLGEKNPVYIHSFIQMMRRYVLLL